MASGSSGADYLFESLPRGSALREAVSDHLPAVITGSIAPEWLDERSVQLAVGGAGSGAPAHYHKAAANTLVYGRKKWWLAPPRDALYSNIPVSSWATQGGPEHARAGGERVLLECTQLAGDVLYLPDFWGHGSPTGDLNPLPSPLSPLICAATAPDGLRFDSIPATARAAVLNLEPSVAVASEFATPRMQFQFEG